VKSSPSWSMSSRNPERESLTSGPGATCCRGTFAALRCEPSAPPELRTERASEDVRQSVLPSAALVVERVARDAGVENCSSTTSAEKPRADVRGGPAAPSHPRLARPRRRQHDEPLPGGGADGAPVIEDGRGAPAGTDGGSDDVRRYETAPREHPPQRRQRRERPSPPFPSDCEIQVHRQSRGL
jgi:hypothetical protein